MATMKQYQSHLKPTKTSYEEFNNENGIRDDNGPKMSDFAK